MTVATLDQLNAWRETLMRARGTGVKDITYSDGRRVTYRDDGELADALADIDRRIAKATATPIHTIRLFGSKGL